MQTESFEIVGRDAAWVVSHNGADGMPYATKEAAFEAAVAAASNAIRAGHDVSIVVQGRRTKERAPSDDWNALS